MSFQHRLTRRDLEYVKTAETRRVSGKHFSVTISTLQEGAAHSKFACIVPKQVASRAVERNSIKRKCRESARVHVQKVKEPIAFVFRGKKGLGTVSFKDIDRDIRSLVENLMDRIQYRQ